MSPFTVFEMVNVVINSGFEPLFIDIDQKSFCMSIQSLEKQINKNICACLFTHHHTNENDYEKILNFCNLNNIYLIEDCATALGSQYKNSNHQVGTLANYSLFSFGFYKTFNMLYGGALSFSSEKKKLKDFYNDMDSFSYILLLKKFIYYFIFKTLLNKYVYSFFVFPLIKFGNNNNINFINNFTKNDPSPYLNKKSSIYNFRMNKVQKYLMHKKSTEYISQLIFKRNNIFKEYLNKFIIFEKYLVLPSYSNKSSCHTFPVIVLNNRRDEIYNFLIKENIDVAKYYYRDCSNLDIFYEYNKNACTNAKYVSNNVILFPCYSEIKSKYIDKIINVLRKILI